VRTRLIAAALITVALGAIIGYGPGSPGSGVAWTIGLSMMLAGTAGLTAVLIRTMTGLRRTTERRRAGSTAPVPRAPGTISRPGQAPVSQISASAALRNSVPIRRLRDGAADE
jgi:hypothetical protein